MRIAPLARTYTASTSRSDRSGRQYPETFVSDIPRRVDVPIVVRVAVNAIPRPDIKRHGVSYRSTRGARLRTRIPAVALEKRPAGARRFVFEETGQHAPPSIASGFCEAVVRHDTLHIQVFDNDDLVFVYEPTTEFVKVVLPGTRNALMRTRDQLPGFVTAIRSLLLSRQHPLLALQVPLRLTQMAGVFELRPLAGDGEVGQTNVDADCLTICRYRRKRIFVVGQDGSVELSAGIAADRHGLELADDLAMDDAIDPADFWQIDARAVDLDTLRVLDRLPPMLRLEMRVFAAFGKEVLECSGEILKRLLQRLAIGITEPFEFLLQLWQADRHRMVVQPLASRAVEFACQCKRIVPGPPRAAELNG